MRRLLVAAAAAALVVGTALAGCSAQDVVKAPHRSTIDVATPDMVAMKAKSTVQACPAAQTTDGGLPAARLPCIGGGRKVDLSTLKGPLLVNFFQGACEPCRKEMPALEAFYAKYGDEVPVLGIDSIDTIPGIALRQAIHRGVTFTMVADPDGDLQGGPLSVTGFPTTYLLTADGTVERLQKGGMTSAAQVRKLVEAKLGTAL